jgi:hypothetical protein
MSYHRENSAPTTEELLLLGFEEWQIKLLRALRVELQWEAHDEFVRRLMTNNDTDNYYF